MTKGSWGASKRSLGQVDHITHDWLTPCEYIPYIDALLRNIDLDPCSTYDANNQFLRAEKLDPDKEALFIIQDTKEMSLVHYKIDSEGASFKQM